jgi:hypothetical protein
LGLREVKTVRTSLIECNVEHGTSDAATLVVGIDYHLAEMNRCFVRSTSWGRRKHDALANDTVSILNDVVRRVRVLERREQFLAVCFALQSGECSHVDALGLIEYGVEFECSFDVVGRTASK